MHQGQQGHYGRKGISGAYKGAHAGKPAGSRNPLKRAKAASKKPAKAKPHNPGY